jgi:drug/metabolite transporter (DMT)-like permease
MTTLKIDQIVTITLTVLTLSAGQVLFKLAANQLHDVHEALKSLTSGWLLLALIVYALATVFWVYTLRSVPLKIAYPFVAFAYFLVPVFAHYILDEIVNFRTFVGASIIIFGVWVSVS